MSKEDRESELSEVYRTSTSLDLTNKKVLIIDDVTTTGTTMIEAAKVLKEYEESVKLYSYCLCKTSRNVNANDDFEM